MRTFKIYFYEFITALVLLGLADIYLGNRKPGTDGTMTFQNMIRSAGAQRNTKISH